MASHENELALAFLRFQPGAAASILERQPPAQVAAFLSETPSQQSAMVLGKILPIYAARIVQAMDQATAIDLMKEMDVRLIAAILRNMNADAAQSLLENLPEKSKLALKLVLNYPKDSVAAWMETQAPTLPDDCTIEEALSRLFAEQDGADTPSVAVVNRERQLQGMVSMTSLLRAPKNVTLTAVMEKNAPSISGRTALKSAIRHTGWSDRDVIAVINRQLHVIGILRHVDLRRGLEQAITTVTHSQTDDPLKDLVNSYRTSLFAFYSATIEIARTGHPGGK